MSPESQQQEYATAESIRVPKITSRSWLILSELSKHIRSVAESELPNNLKICDVGCGKKPYFEFFKEKSDLYVGIDIDRTSSAGIIATAEYLPFIEKSFDVVLCIQVLEHVYNPEKVINKMYRVLKRNGTLVLSTHGIWFKHELHDYWRWTDSGLMKILNPPFKKIEVKSCGGTILCLFQFLNLYVRYLPFGKKALYLINNVLGRALDNMYHNEDLVINYFVIARK